MFLCPPLPLHTLLHPFGAISVCDNYTMCVFFPCVFLAPVPGCVADAGRHGYRHRGISPPGVPRGLGGRPGPEEHLLCLHRKGPGLRRGQQVSQRRSSGICADMEPCMWWPELALSTCTCMYLCLMFVFCIVTDIWRGWVQL